jgi:hypothetical protein
MLLMGPAIAFKSVTEKSRCVRSRIEIDQQVCNLSRPEHVQERDAKRCKTDRALFDLKLTSPPTTSFFVRARRGTIVSLLYRQRSTTSDLNLGTFVIGRRSFATKELYKKSKNQVSCQRKSEITGKYFLFLF